MKRKLSGGCHCQRVRYELEVEAPIEVTRCNCSICRSMGFIHLIVAAQHFRLIKGQSDLTEYRFNTGTARHLFCRHCGVKSFYHPRSHPDGISVNVNTLDQLDEIELTVTDFDGQNWEANIAKLKG